MGIPAFEAEKFSSLKLKNFSLPFGVQLFKALGDESRIRILHILFHKGELSITDLELIMDFTQTKAARLVGVLKNANLIQSRRVDHWVLYKVKEEAMELLGQILEYMEKEPVFQSDLFTCEALSSNRELSINKLAMKQYKPDLH
jgi:ArsR family transcriptional regulator